MGSNKTATTTTTQTATEQEKALQAAQLKQYQAYEPQQTEMYKSAFGLGNQLLNSFGGQDSNMWKSLIGGVTDEQQQRMIAEQDRYLKPQLQQQGIYDSGMAATGRLRAAVDLSNQNAQFNVGALQNALNLALSGQAQVQSPATNLTGQISSRLAGLRTTTSQTPLKGYNIGALGTYGGQF